MSSTPVDTLTDEARRVLRICNLCGYCNGLCPVFEAARRRPLLQDPDLEHLAHLCHDCRACFYDCQYAPPHAFALNLPPLLARLRWASYAKQAWPSALARLFQADGQAAAGLAGLIIALVMIAVVVLNPAERLFARDLSPGAFYRLVPHGVMVVGGLVSLGWALLAITVSVWRFARQTTTTAPTTPNALIITASDILHLTHLRGGGPGCYERAGSGSQQRRGWHQLLLLGLLCCLAATLVALVEHHGLHRPAPYPLISLPVLLGSTGGVAMLLGALGLGRLRWRADPEPLAVELRGADWVALALVLLVVGSGLALLLWRATAAMGLFLALHLGAVLALFVLLPYSRLIHGLYRAVALWRDARERTAHSNTKNPS